MTSCYSSASGLPEHDKHQASIYTIRIWPREVWDCKEVSCETTGRIARSKTVEDTISSSSQPSLEVTCPLFWGYTTGLQYK